jgi:hypothetical protein
MGTGTAPVSTDPTPRFDSNNTILMPTVDGPAVLLSLQRSAWAVVFRSVAVFRQTLRRPPLPPDWPLPRIQPITLAISQPCTNRRIMPPIHPMISSWQRNSAD